jgi:Right handed beta helix region
MYALKINVFLLFFLSLFLAPSDYAQVVYVSPTGNDSNPGTREKPLATFNGAKEFVRNLKNSGNKKIEVNFLKGTYYLSASVVFKPEDSGSPSAPVIYKAEEDGSVSISGGRKLDCVWKSYKNGIFECSLPGIKKEGLDFTQLFVSGKRQHRARYPNYDNSDPGKSGYIWPEKAISEDAKDPKPDNYEDMNYNNPVPKGIVYNPLTFTQRKWSQPEEAVIHIFQAPHWQILQWKIKDIDYKKHYIWFGKGGFQLGAKWTGDPVRVSGESQFFVENVFEELDAPGEWYWNKDEGILYYKPAEGVDLNSVVFEIPVLKSSIQFRGSQYNPVHDITISGFRFIDTKATFMDTYSVPSKSDWAIHRGGTIFSDGAENINVKNCWFDAVGGNAVFMNNYNRGNVVTSCKFTGTGESAVCFVGNFELTNGSNLAFPFECKAVDNLIHDCGYFGKQIAGVYISRAKRITVSHNLIYNMPRAGICIGDGTWGGDTVEFNDMHDCVRETWDHGPFNSWGREGYWSLTHAHSEGSFTYPFPAGDVKVWAMETNVIRNNYIHGMYHYDGGYYQALDLDDGSSNFDVKNNVCVGMGISIREGDYRTVENNIIIDPVVPVGAHVGHPGNHDKIIHNIIVTDNSIYYMNDCPAKDPLMSEINNNLFYQPDPGWGNRTVITVRRRGEATHKYTLEEWQKLGYDTSSVVVDPMFVDLKNGDYTLKPDSPALKLGFKNIDMSWGLTNQFPDTFSEKEK